jgi:nucleoside-diphosphate-sugar epimerase
VRRAVSKQAAWLLGLLLEGIYKTLRLSGEPPMTRFIAEELATSHWFNIAAAKRDLGYQPVVSTSEGLKRLAEWLREERDKGKLA